MLQDGPKKIGRFLKKNDKVLQHVVLQDYSLEEISESPIVSFDNAKSTVVHAKLHDAAALNKAVFTPPTFNDSLVDPQNNRAIIQPRDFTADWRASRNKAGSRRKDLEDDDEDLLGGTPYSTASQPSPDPMHSMSQASMDEAKSASDKFVAKPSEKVAEPTNQKPFRFERFDNGPTQSDSLEQLRPTAPIFDPNEVVKAAASIASHAGPVVDPHEAKVIDHPSSDFIAMPHADTPMRPHSVATPETAAADEYRSRMAVQETNERILSTLKEEARSAGYREGFKLGEEKAELQSRTSAQTLFSHVSDLIGEFEGLKTSVLVNAQQNFYELAQAMGETLLGKEFSIRPEAFAAVIRKAVDETVESDSFKIRVHPETYDRLSKLELSDLKKRLVKDSTVGIDHFRIESHLTVVDQNARKLIANLLEQADVDLFAGTDIKAG